MFEIIIFVIAFAIAQVLAGLMMMGIMMKLMTNKRFLINYTKMILKVMEELNEELY